MNRRDADMEAVFGPPPNQPDVDAPSTAATMAAFRDELVEHGFPDGEVAILVRIALEGEIRGFGLTIVAPGGSD